MLMKLFPIRAFQSAGWEIQCIRLIVAMVSHLENIETIFFNLIILLLLASQNSITLKCPYPGKWHVFILALLYLFECLNE